jgi:hypothetical protein
MEFIIHHSTQSSIGGLAMKSSLDLSALNPEGLWITV